MIGTACPDCQGSLRLLRSMPKPAGFETRTFECRRRAFIHAYTVSARDKISAPSARFDVEQRIAADQNHDIDLDQLEPGNGFGSRASAKFIAMPKV